MPQEFDFSDLNTNLDDNKEFDFSDLNTDDVNKKTNSKTPVKNVMNNSSGLPEKVINAVSKSPIESLLSSTPIGITKGLKTLKEPLKNVMNDLSGVPLNVLQGLIALPGKAINAATQVPDAGRQIFNDPIRAGKNIAAGGAELLGDISRIPPQLVDYLSKIGLIKPETAEKFARPLSEEDIKSGLDKFVGEKQPGDDLIRSSIRNIPEIYGASKIASLLNPMKLTSKNISKEILEAEKNIKNKYSGKDGLYTKNFEKTRGRGLSEVNVSPAKIDMDSIKKYVPEKYYESTENFLKERSLENAQKSISDLGYIERRLGNQITLTSPERKVLNSVKNAKNHIQESMFTDENGILHPDLLSEHADIQKGYANEVIPYSKNQNIRKFKDRKLTPEELINRLSKGEFYVKKGNEHKSIGIRKFTKNLVGNKLSQGAILGAGGIGAYNILNKLLGNDE